MCKNFTYLGSTVSESARLDQEITLRMGKASAVYGKLQKRMWRNRHVTNRTKSKVYHAVVLSTLLYGAETWTIYQSQVKNVHAYSMRHLKEITNISWKDKIPNKLILEKAGLPPMADILFQTNLGCLNHIERMEFAKLPRQMLYSQLREGKRNQGRPRPKIQGHWEQKSEAEEHCCRNLEAASKRQNNLQKPD